MADLKRSMPVGAELLPGGGVHFRVWATGSATVGLLLDDSGELLPMRSEGEGYFSRSVQTAGPGTRYRYLLDDGGRYPDPASRYQPDGPHGPSSVVDPSFPWSDGGWKGLSSEGQVIYEMHVGTYTREGTWSAASAHLGRLAELGITTVEMLPVADFPGRFGWGYDGVNLFAPTRLYGTPDDLRRFVDRAHAAGIGVVLDVVYNHLGPEGNYLRHFSPQYYMQNRKTEWGDPINYDGNGSEPVREFILANAGYWIREFHFDGLRFDAIQAVFDDSPRHLLSMAVEAARAAAGAKRLLILAENEPQQVRCLLPESEGGFGMDAAWSDDFHHSARVAATGYNEAYYREYLGNPQELVSAVKWSYLYQGQRYFWQGKPRGTPTRGIRRHRFVHYLQNHDQVANSASGKRLHHFTSPGRYRAISALLLLSPQTPLIFQGQEFAASSRFLYFSDLAPQLAEKVRKGRVEFLRQFGNIDTPEIAEALDRPDDPATFERCVLDHGERESNGETYRLYGDLMKLRRQDPVFRELDANEVDGAVLGPEAFLIRYAGREGERLLLFNLGRDLRMHPAPEPLLAPPLHREWRILWSSESPRYGGSGTPTLETGEEWLVPGHAAVVLEPGPATGN